MDDYSLSRTEEHLNLLVIFHYLLAGMLALFSLFPVIHLIMGIIFIVSPPSSNSGGGPPPVWFGVFFVVFASVMIVFGEALAALVLYAGLSIRSRRRFTFCLVVAGLMCLWMPFGTALGVFTIIVLFKEETKYLFGIIEEDAGPADPE